MTRDETKRELELFPSRYAVNGTVDKLFDHFEAQFKAKDKEMQKMRNCCNCKYDACPYIKRDCADNNYKYWECRE